MNWIEKHRPQNFTELIGLNEALTAIESFILSGDIPHLLFYGEAGTGKTTTAHIIAHKLLGEYFEMNFTEINASDTREEGDMRKKVLRALKHKPIGSSIRVILLDEADGLKPTAQDLLKRPIEKTKNTLFIITCNDITSIIKPIKSRCALFEFKLTESDIVEGLKRIVVKEVSIGDDVLQKIAKKADGDMRAAVNELQKAAALNSRNSEIDRIVQQYMKSESIDVK